MKASKVKPRTVPTALRIREVAEDQVPPPTPVRVIQQVGTMLCAIPADELSEDTLLATHEEEPKTSD